MWGSGALAGTHEGWMMGAYTLSLGRQKQTAFAPGRVRGRQHPKEGSWVMGEGQCRWLGRGALQDPLED